VVPGAGVALAWSDGELQVPTDSPAQVVADLAALDPRWVWWSARETAAGLVAAGVRPRTCWDLGAVARLVHGVRREDPAAVWASAQSLPEPALRSGPVNLLDLDDAPGPVGADGQLSGTWVADGEPRTLSAATSWARLAMTVQGIQASALAGLPDPRAAPGDPPLRVLTAYAESAAALLAV
jgi:DNA polymerase-1